MMAQGLVVPIMTPILTISSPTVTEGGYGTFTASLSNHQYDSGDATKPNVWSRLQGRTQAASSLQYYNGTSWVSAGGPRAFQREAVVFSFASRQQMTC